MKQFSYTIFASLLLVACAQSPKRSVVESLIHVPEHGVPGHEMPGNDMGDTSSLPNIELSDELLYQFLLTEIASQRGHIALAVQGSADLANRTRDPRLAMRAAQLSLQSGQMDMAIEALKVWREIEPASPLAMRMYSSALLRSGRLDEARQELVAVLNAKPDSAGHIFFQIYQMLASYPDKEQALKLVQELAQPYPRVAEAHWAVAQLAQASGNEELALREVRLAGSLSPGWNMAASLEAQILSKNSPLQSLEVFSRYLSSYPNEHEIRLQYARALLVQKQYKQARDQFLRLEDENPGDPETTFTIALISLQMKDVSGAEEYLKQSLSKGKQDQDTVHYYLGQLSEAKLNVDEAIEHYRRVSGGDYLFAAQIRIINLLSKRGQLDEAMQVLQQIRAANNQQRVQLMSVQAQLLRESNRLPEAYEVLQNGLTKLPDNPDLLYGAAMLADRLDKPDVFEQLMRKLIELQPDHAQAYNALGYGLLERNERIPEAVQLVEKALQLSPDDPAIMDSVGWGYYRSGKLDDSVKILKRAFADSPDPEIAAHLGEVLWVRGDEMEARKIWQESLEANPGNTYLQAVMKKFMP